MVWPNNEHRSECTRRCTQPAAGRRQALETGRTQLPPGKVFPLASSSVKQLVLVAVAGGQEGGPNIVSAAALLPARLAGGRTWPLLPHIPLQAARQNEGQPRSYVAKE